MLLIVIFSLDILSNDLYALGIIALFILLSIVISFRQYSPKGDLTGVADLLDEITDIVAIVAIATMVVLTTGNRNGATVPGDIALGGIVSIAIGKRVLKLRSNTDGAN